jgi:tRNA(fMet)-specific endonuclease VapC
LDTNAVSALMKGDQAVIARVRTVARSDVVMPQPVVAEIAYGIERLPRSKRRRALIARFELILGELGRSAWTDGVSERFGVIKATLERRGERIEDFDAAVAAHAMAESAVLVTANRRHMARIGGLRLEDWAKPASRPSR